MKRFIIGSLALLFFFSCKNDSPQKSSNNEEVAFNIDSTLFDFQKIDTFLNVKTPNLINWKVNKLLKEDKTHTFILTHPDSLLTIEIQNFKARQPNSYNFYSNLNRDNKLSAELLDISTFLKNDKKLIQIILKDKTHINFKLIEDLNEISKEVNIFIPITNYVESNISIVESIIGVLDFI